MIGEVRVVGYGVVRKTYFEDFEVGAAGGVGCEGWGELPFCWGGSGGAGEVVDDGVLYGHCGGRLPEVVAVRSQGIFLF